MRKSEVQGKVIEFPEPLYVLTETIKISQDGLSVTGQTLYPSIDPTVGDRVDHANLVHHQFATWNVARIVGHKRNWKKVLAQKVSASAYIIVRPDTKIDFRGNLVISQCTERKELGSGTMIFLKNDREVARVDVDFVAYL